MTAATAARDARVEAFARGPVFVIAAVTGAVLLIGSAFHGLAADELWFYAAGKHPALAYADQPPLVPLLAGAMDAIAPGSLLAFRLPSVLATVAGVVVAALIARELGGDRRAQILTAASYAVSFQVFVAGSMLATHTVDALLWSVLTLLVIRWVRTREDRLLLCCGLVTAVALQAKFLVVGLWPVLLGCALVVGPKELPRRPLLWAGALVAVLTTVPMLIWHAASDWPQLRMVGAISAEGNRVVGTLTFLPQVFYTAGIPVGGLLLVYGCWRLLRAETLRLYRFLGWTTVVLTAVFLVASGRPYYIAGLYAVCWAAAVVELRRAPVTRWSRWLTAWPVYAMSAVLTFSGTVVVGYVSGVGWRELSDTVVARYQALPADVREHTVIITDTYSEAGAIERFGVPQGLPSPYSGKRGYWYLGAPPQNADTILFVGPDRSGLLADSCTDLEQVAETENPLGVTNGSHRKPVWLCTGLRAPWSELWPKFLHYD